MQCNICKVHISRSPTKTTHSLTNTSRATEAIPTSIDQRYDVVIVDAYDNNDDVPMGLDSLPMLELIRERWLSPSCGVVLANVANVHTAAESLSRFATAFPSSYTLSPTPHCRVLIGFASANIDPAGAIRQAGGEAGVSSERASRRAIQQVLAARHDLLVRECEIPDQLGSLSTVQELA